MESEKSYLKFFKKFYDEWKLDYEKKKIDLWREMRHLNSDILLYTPSVNHRSDSECSESMKANSSGSRSLKILSTFWDDLDQVREIEDAISKMSDHYKQAFFDYFIHDKNNHLKDQPFLKEDVLVELASHDEDYVFADEIKRKYDLEKKKTLEKISARRKEIKLYMTVLLEKHKKFLIERALEQDIAYLKENQKSGAHHRKISMYVDVLRYLEGDIDGQELWRCIADQKGGKKIYKKIFKG